MGRGFRRARWNDGEMDKWLDNGWLTWVSAIAALPWREGGAGELCKLCEWNGDVVRRGPGRIRRIHRMRRIEQK